MGEFLSISGNTKNRILDPRRYTCSSLAMRPSLAVKVTFCRAMFMQNVTFTARDGRIARLEHVYLRGSKIRFFVLPDMLRNSPMFKNAVSKGKGKTSGLGIGRGARSDTSTRGGRGGSSSGGFRR
eukprot:TRINITY_DN15691_c0_g1_i3.p1 TRINITY_DN15691_c0_g1~~TRINITY_DN15691_c0_g1_i3.p1  ORF type:complete len:125 (+),score=17.82 TRINITY_DN15691_c0_g1_i3:284-658(+)